MKKCLIMFCLLLPFFGGAQIICTDVNPDITNSGNASLDFDLNNDLTQDFRITSAQSGGLSFVVVQGSNIGTNNFVLTSGTNSAACLPLNAPIGATSTTWVQMNSTNQQMVLVVNSSVSGPWTGATDQYLGLALAVGSNTYYGWARFSFTNNSNQYTFKDYAYQSTAGTQILAGQGCGGSITNPVFYLPDSICAGTTVTVSAGTGTGVPSSYMWAVPSGVTNSSPSSSSTALTFTAAGNSTVILAVTQGTSIIGTAIHTIQIKPLPTLTLTPLSATACPGSSVTLTASGTGTLYSWTPTVNITPLTGQTVVVSPTATTLYSVQSTLNGCSTIKTAVVVFNPFILPPLQSSSNTLCAAGYNGSMNQVTVSATGYSLSSSSIWPFSANSVGTGGLILSPAQPYFTTNTLVVVTLTVSNAFCSASKPFSITVIANPTIGLNAVPSSVCAGNTVTITPSGGSAYAWMINAPNTSTISSTGNILITPTTNVSFTIFAMQGACSSQSIVNTFSLIPPPSVIVTSATTCVNALALLSATGGTISSYLWSGPSGYSSTSQSISINAGPSPGIAVYTINVVDVNSCSGTAQATVTAVLCTGLDAESMGVIRLFPQPAADHLYLKCSAEGSSAYTIFDLAGKILDKGTFEQQTGTVEIIVSSLPPGVYFLEVSTQNGKTREKFLKE